MTAPAQAATVIGVDPNLASDGAFICTTCPAAMIQDVVDGNAVTAPNGVITRVEFEGTGDLQFNAYRPSLRSSTQLTVAKVGGASVSGAGSGFVTFADVRIPVRAGDMIGIVVPAPGASIAFRTVFINSVAWFGTVGAGGGVNTTDNAAPDNYELLYRAKVEPDADGDQYGDETQDACPTNASTRGACPPPPPPPTNATQKLKLGSKKVVARRGKAEIPLNNPNGVPIAGKITLKLGKKKVGSARYSLAAGSGKTVKVKLSKAARKRLKAKRRLRLSYVATAKGKTGATFTAKGKLTVRNPPKKRRAPSGGGLDGTYVKAPESGPGVRFKVTNGGRRIVDLTGVVSGSCFIFGFPTGHFELRGLLAGIRSLPVAADGSFSGKDELSGFTTEITKGKLKGGVATGHILVKGKGCSGSADFKSIRG